MLDISSRKRRWATRILDWAGWGLERASQLVRRRPVLGDPRAARFERILVVRPDHIGDVIMMTPVLRALRQRYPRAHIAVLVGSWGLDIVRHNPHVDEVIVLDCPWWAGIRAKTSDRPTFWSQYRALVPRLATFDLMLDPRGDFRHILLFGRRPGIPYRIGYARTGGAYWLTTVCPFDPSLHNVRKNLALLQPLGIDEPSLATEVFPGPEAAERIEKWIDEKGFEHRPLAVIHPGARTFVKKWSAESFARAADFLAHEKGCAIALVGGKEELALTQSVAGKMTAPAHVLAGELSLLDLVALFARAKVVLCNDSGPMHLAAAAGAPILALFGPTDPNVYGYSGPGQRWIWQRLDCSPCNFESSCPYTSGPVSKCLDELSFERVQAELAELLAESPKPQVPSS